MGAYLGVGGSDSSGAENRYSLASLFNQPMYLTLGTVLNSYQAAQYCEVALDTGGRRVAISLGLGRGYLGANEAGGFVPGERVLVACSFASSSPAVIMGRYDYAKAGEYYPPCNLLVYPQVAGYRYGERMSGKTYADFPRAVRNFISGPADAVDGDWIMANMFGGAVGVEAFRTFLRGGPASGFYCYTEDQTVKIIGSKIDMVSFAETSQESETGDATLRVQKRYLTPGDQLVGYQAQILQFTGKAAGGYQQFVTYPDGLNGSGIILDEAPNAEGEFPDPPEGEESDETKWLGKSRVAMIHEYRGADGSYALSAANSILFQKTIELPVPIDVLEAENRLQILRNQQAEAEEAAEEAKKEAEETEEAVAQTIPACGCDACQLTPNPDPLFCADPNDPGATNRPEFRFESHARTNPLAYAMNARGLADRLIRWQAVGGITNLAQFLLGDEPNPELYGNRSSAELLISKSPDMWKCMPQTIKLGLLPSGRAKRMYFGRAIISITEDGSLVFQDAQGSQIMLSGGNIFLSAQHDIIDYAGRNRLVMSGRDAAVRAGRHCDIMANEGRLTMLASNEASLVGGLDGHGGVLIESRGQYQATIDTGTVENPPTSGALVLKAKHMVGVRASHIALRADQPSGWSGLKDGAGLVSIDAKTRVSIRSRDNRTAATFGRGFSIVQQGDIDVLGGMFFDGGNLSVTESVYASRNVFYQQLFRNVIFVPATGSAVGFRCGGLWKAVDHDMEAWVGGSLNPTSPLQEDQFTARWLSSKQLNVDQQLFFTIPQPEWQLRLTSAMEDNSTLRNSFIRDNLLDETAPFPGADAWQNFALSSVTYDPPTWDEEPQINLDVTTGGADGKLFKGV